MQFKKATKNQSKLRMAITAPPGGGKTWTALALAKFLGGRVALVDTEHGSASKYADTFDFDSMELDTFAGTTPDGGVSFCRSALVPFTSPPFAIWGTP
jgi:hypothetical protein